MRKLSGFIDRLSARSPSPGYTHVLWRDDSLMSNVYVPVLYCAGPALFQIDNSIGLMLVHAQSHSVMQVTGSC